MKRLFLAIGTLAIVTALIPIVGVMMYVKLLDSAIRATGQAAITAEPAASTGWITMPAEGVLGTTQAWVLRQADGSPAVVIKVSRGARGGWTGYVYHPKPLAQPLLVMPFGLPWGYGVYAGTEFIGVQPSRQPDISFADTRFD